MKVSKEKHSFVLFTDVDNDVIKVGNIDFRLLYNIHDLHLSSKEKDLLETKTFPFQNISIVVV